MNLVLNLPHELESRLAADAARLGLPLSEHVVRLLSAAKAPRRAASCANGAELLAYWQAEGLTGSRPDIADAPAHARFLREQAQRRTRG